jgi:hypothetical protein
MLVKPCCNSQAHCIYGCQESKTWPLSRTSILAFHTYFDLLLKPCLNQQGNSPHRWLQGAQWRWPPRYYRGRRSWHKRCTPAQQKQFTVGGERTAQQSSLHFHPNFSAPRIPKVHLWFTCSAGQGNLPTAAKWSNLVGSSLK